MVVSLKVEFICRSWVHNQPILFYQAVNVSNVISRHGLQSLKIWLMDNSSVKSNAPANSTWCICSFSQYTSILRQYSVHCWSPCSFTTLTSQSSDWNSLFLAYWKLVHSITILTSDKLDYVGSHFSMRIWTDPPSRIKIIFAKMGGGTGVSKKLLFPLIRKP